MHDEFVPPTSEIQAWIERIFSHGIRRPGYPADRWTEGFCVEQFRKLGLEKVRLEPVKLPYWEPLSWSLRASGVEGDLHLECFPLPHSAPADALELELSAFDPAHPEWVSGRAALTEVRLLRFGPSDIVSDAPDLEGVPNGRIVDPRNTFVDRQQILPFAPNFQAVMEPVIGAGASAFIGYLYDHPADSYRYYVPYDGLARSIPGVWIRGSDGRRLRQLLERGAVRVWIDIDTLRSGITSSNVVGELPGGDRERVVIGSHHDGPWASAVEDAGGVALVLAQAAYWSRVPKQERPHRLVFLLNAGHIAGGAGCHTFLRAHASELDRMVLAIHLEHPAREFATRKGVLSATGEPEPRWFFTSRNPQLERNVLDALRAEQLERCLILPPQIFGGHPTTDGGPFHLYGVPLVNFLSAPFYLFDAMDSLDKIDEAGLVPLTRATIRIIEATRGVSASAMREGVVT